jgi:hypothetical protein
MQPIVIETGGEIVAVGSDLGWVDALLREGSQGAVDADARAATMTIHIEASTGPFSVRGLAPLTRNAWSGPGEVVIADVCGSGFDVRLRLEGGRADFAVRWRPAASRHAARFALPTRFRLLTREALIHYPVLWWASVNGRAPLHAVACTVGDSVALLAGPGGVGKSTLLHRELAAGGRATSDNLCVGDGRGVWGLVEPMRIEGDRGARTTHGRVEVVLERRVTSLEPDQVVIVRRGEGESPVMQPCSAEAAVRSLVTGTYSAGELSRFWGYAAALASGTGLGPAHPRVEDVARAFAARLECFELRLGRTPGARLSDMLVHAEAIA